MAFFRPALLNEREVASVLGLSIQTLRNARSRGVGLRYLKIGRRVLYDPADLEKFIERARVNTESPAPPGVIA